MVGGVVVQVLQYEACQKIEVLNEHSMDRCWRKIRRDVDVQWGDQIWWQSFTGMLSRGDSMHDENIGPCTPCDGPDAVEEYVKATKGNPR